MEREFVDLKHDLPAWHVNKQCISCANLLNPSFVGNLW